jgi:hypothetical protein
MGEVAGKESDVIVSHDFVFLLTDQEYYSRGTQNQFMPHRVGVLSRLIKLFGR